MDAIFIHYQPFSADSSIEIFKNGELSEHKISSKVEDITNTIVGLAYQDDIYEVRVAAPFAIQSEIKRQVNQEERQQYELAKINVEGI